MKTGSDHLEAWMQTLTGFIFLPVWTFFSGGSLTKLPQKRLSDWSEYQLCFGAAVLGTGPTGARLWLRWVGGAVSVPSTVSS